MTSKQLSLCASTSAMLVLVGCAPLSHWPGPDSGSPANPLAQTAPYVPPSNPYDNSDATSSGVGESHAPQDAVKTYTCTMHPEIRSDEPVRCPKCGMTLTPLKGTEKHVPRNGGMR